MKNKFMWWVIFMAWLLSITFLFASYFMVKSVGSPLPWEQRVENRINIVRLNHGLEPVDFGPCVDKWAENWVYHIPHNGFTHSNMYSLMRQCRATAAGEVMADGVVPLTPRKVVRMWMHSPGHRAILLDPKYTNIGVGSIKIPDNDLMVRYVVVDFVRH